MPPPELSTADTIDSFLERFAPDTPRVDEAKEDIIAAPAIDYAAMIDDDEEEGIVTALTLRTSAPRAGTRPNPPRRQPFRVSGQSHGQKRQLSQGFGNYYRIKFE